MFIHYLNLMTNVKMSVMTYRCETLMITKRIWTHFSQLWSDFDCFLGFLHKNLERRFCPFLRS
jgi:hypothetical protein